MEATQNSSEGFLNPNSLIGQFGVGSGMRVADFGCGAGHIAILVAQRLGKEGKLVALDIMEDKLDSMRTRAKALGLENIETVRANLEILGSTGLGDASQDIVMLINILFQSVKKQDILKEAFRVLKYGGVMVAVDWKKSATGLGPPDELRTSESDMQAMCVAAGFSMKRSLDAGRFITDFYSAVSIYIWVIKKSSTS